MNGSNQRLHEPASQPGQGPDQPIGLVAQMQATIRVALVVVAASCTYSMQ